MSVYLCSYLKEISYVKCSGIKIMVFHFRIVQVHILVNTSPGMVLKRKTTKCCLTVLNVLPMFRWLAKVVFLPVNTPNYFKPVKII